MDESTKVSEYEKKPPDQFVLNPGLLQQFRQLSIPIWARIVVLVLVGLVFAADVVLIIILFFHDVGLNTPIFLTPKSTEHWLSSSVALLGSIFVPAMVVAYLVFAETGVPSLRSKTRDILTKLIPECLNEIKFPGFNDVIDLVIIKEGKNSTRCQYEIRAARDGETKKFRLVVSLNVKKAWIAVLLKQSSDASDYRQYHRSVLQQHLKHTIEGAQIEGYSVMQEPSVELIDGACYINAVIIKPLQEDFLWDPAQKLHFAQDLAAFCHSTLNEGWDTILEAA